MCVCVCVCVCVFCKCMYYGGEAMEGRLWRGGLCSCNYMYNGSYHRILSTAHLVPLAHSFMYEPERTLRQRLSDFLIISRKSSATPELKR